MNEIKEKFRIGNYDFSIDYNNSNVEIEGDNIIDLRIKADEKIFDELCENDDFEFSYGIYSPEFYAREIDLGEKRQIIISEENKYDYETALYFMEHNDVEIKLSFIEKWILIEGWAYIFGNKYPIEITMKK